MATTQTAREYTGDGSDLTWAYAFQSYQSSDIKVQVTNSAGTFVNVTNFTVPDWSASSGTVTFNNTGVDSNVCESTGAPKNNRIIRIYRETDVTTGVVGQIDPKATYAAGSSIKAEDLNNNQKQALYAVYELRDQERITGNIRDDAITGAKIKDDEIDSQHYAAGSIDLEHMSANSVDSDQYVDGSIDHVHLAADAVDGDNIADDSINSEHIAAGAVDLAHMSANSVDSSKIVDGTIVNADVSASAAIAGSKIAPDFGNQAISGRDLQLTDGDPSINFVDPGDDPDYEIIVNAGNFTIKDATASADRFQISASSTTVTNNFNANGGVDVTGNITVTGTVDGRDVAADGTKLDGIEASADVTDATNVNAAGAVMNSDLDGKGELLVGDGSGDPTALAVGTNNYVLTADSSEATGIKWAASAAGETNQNAFSNVAVTGQTTVAADAATDTLTLAGGSNITITTNDSTDTVTIAASGGEITVQDEGSSLSTAATTINFAGNGVTATGTGATKTITIPGGGASSIDDDSIVEAKLDIHNAPSGTDKYLKYTANGMEWATAGSGTPEGTAILSTGESGGTKFLREDGDGSCSWQSVPAGVTQENVEDWVGGMVTGNTETGIAVTYDDSDGTLDFVVASQTPEGTAVLSTGETGTTKFLRVDGDNSCSWQVPPDTNTQLSTEEVQDIVGGMVTGNTETGIAVTYEDGDGTLDFVVGTLNQDTTGTAAIATTVTVADESSDTTCFPLFATAATGDLGPKSGSNLTFNSNTGALGATSFAGDGSALTNLPAAIGQITEHKATMTANHTIGTGNNGLVAGPFSTGSYTLTIPSGSVFTVV